MSTKEITEKFMPVQVNTLNDLVRLVMTFMAPGQVMYLIKYRDGDKTILAFMTVIRDYYKYYGLPVLYYYAASGEEARKILENNYILVDTHERESLSFSKSPRPGVAIPLISLREKPLFFP